MIVVIGITLRRALMTPIIPRLTYPLEHLSRISSLGIGTALKPRAGFEGVVGLSAG